MTTLANMQLFEFLAVIPRANHAVINTRLETRFYGPNCFSIRIAEKSAPTVWTRLVAGWRLTANQLKDLKWLADNRPAAEIALWCTERRRVPYRMRQRIRDAFDRPEYQVENPAARTNARVFLRANPIDVNTFLGRLDLVRM